MTIRKLLGVATAALIGLAVAQASPAFADPPSWAGHGHGHDQDESYDRNDHDAYEHHDMDEHHEHHHHHHDKIVIEAHQRDVIREYISHHRDHWCPPGLAKKHDHCVPPGHLRYNVGEVLPGTVRYEVVPATVVRTFAPLPRQDMYVRVGGDIYVMDKTDRTILDAVTLMNDLR